MIIKLWENNIPYYNSEYGEEPFLTPYIVDGAKSCVIVAPGGAYIHKAHGHEGVTIAEEFNKNGISAFVLDYRVAPYSYPAILEDVLRAVRVVRREAKNFGYCEDKIAVLGFSAGGHLASMSVTQFDYGRTDGDETDKISSRPDIGILCYPVITLGKYTHSDTKKFLLGEKINDDELAKKLSSEKAVRDDTPPCFIWHTAEDSAVPCENSLLFASALSNRKIPFELHIFPYGEHGLGLAQNSNNGYAAVWMTLAVRFIKTHLE